MCDELCEQDIESLPLPKGWAANARNSVLNVIGMDRQPGEAIIFEFDCFENRRHLPIFRARRAAQTLMWIRPPGVLLLTPVVLRVSFTQIIKDQTASGNVSRCPRVLPPANSVYGCSRRKSLGPFTRFRPEKRYKC